MPCSRDAFVESWDKTAFIQQIVPCSRDAFVESWNKTAFIQQIVPCGRDAFVEFRAKHNRQMLCPHLILYRRYSIIRSGKGR